MENFRNLTYNWAINNSSIFHLRSIGNFQLYPPERETRRKVNFCEIFWCIEGKANFWLNKKEYTLRPKYVWYYPRGAYHDYSPKKEGFHYRWLTIAGKNSETLFDGLGIKPGINYAGDCPEYLFLLIQSSLDKQNNEPQNEVLSMAFQILTMISPSYNKTPQHIGIAQKAKNMIDAEFTNSEFNVDKIASTLSVHRVSLSRAFSMAYNITLSQYIYQSRLKNSIKLLQTTNLPIKDIANMSGFCSQEYFTRWFSLKTGFSPVVFRKKNRH